MTTATTISDLIAERRRLSLASANGDKTAEGALAKIERQIADAALAEERAQLAAEQAELDRKEAERRRIDEERAARQAALDALNREETEALREVQAKTSDLAAAVGRALALRGDSDRLRALLKQPTEYLHNRRVSNFISWKLADGGLRDFYVRSELQRPLVDD